MRRAEPLGCGVLKRMDEVYSSARLRLNPYAKRHFSFVDFLDMLGFVNYETSMWRNPDPGIEVRLT